MEPGPLSAFPTRRVDVLANLPDPALSGTLEGVLAALPAVRSAVLARVSGLQAEYALEIEDRPDALERLRVDIQHVGFHGLGLVIEGTSVAGANAVVVLSAMRLRDARGIRERRRAATRRGAGPGPSASRPRGAPRPSPAIPGARRQPGRPDGPAAPEPWTESPAVPAADSNGHPNAGAAPGPTDPSRSREGLASIAPMEAAYPEPPRPVAARRPGRMVNAVITIGRMAASVFRFGQAKTRRLARSVTRIRDRVQRRARVHPRAGPAISSALAVATVIGALYLAVLHRIPGGGPFPFSTDAMGHLYRVRYVAEQLRTGHPFPQWTPDWYLGTPLVEFYPPAVTFLLGPLAAALGISATYKVFVGVAVGAAGLLTTLFFRKRLGLAGATAAGLLYALSPWVLRTVFSEGHLPATLFAALLPVAVWAFLRLFERPGPGRFLLFTLLTAVAVLSHQLLALMLFFSTGVSAALSTALAPGKRLGGLLAVGLAMVLGAGIAAWWLLPAMLPLDFAGTPNNGAAERLFIYSRDAGIFDPGARANLLQAYVGLGLVGLGLAGFAYGRRMPGAFFLGALAAVCFAMALGMNNPVVERLAILQEFIFFERFLLIASLALALLGGLLVRRLGEVVGRWLPAGLVGSIAVGLILGLIWWDNGPYFAQVRNTDHAVWVETTNALAARAPPGRLADFIGRPELSYFPPAAGRAALFGWSIEGTPHAELINLLALAMRKGHERFAGRQLQQWWVSGAYALDGDTGTEAILRANGFQPGATVSGVVPWTRSEPVSFASSQRRNAIVVGRGRLGAAVVFPWLALPDSDDVRELTEARLDDAALVVIAEGPAELPGEVAERLDRYFSRGGAALVLLTNDPGRWRSDVGVVERSFPEEMLLVDKTGRFFSDALPVRGFGAGLGEWRALVVDDPRAQTLLALRTADGSEWPVLSRIRMGNGVLFVAGASAQLHGFDHADEPLIPAIEQVLAAGIPALYTGDTLPGLTSSVERLEGGLLDVVVDAGETGGPVVLSVTAAPHWSRATVDGKPVTPRSYEGLVLVDLGPGVHTIRMTQSATTPMWLGRAATAGSLAFLAVIVWGWRRWLTAAAGAASAEPSAEAAAAQAKARNLAVVGLRAAGELALGVGRLLDALFGTRDGEGDERDASEPRQRPGS